MFLARDLECMNLMTCSLLPLENLEAQTKLEQLETDRALDLEHWHSESLAQLEERQKKESLSQNELDAQLAALKLAESESKKSIKEHYEAEMRRVSEVNTSLKQQLDTLNDRLHTERQQAEKQRQEREVVIQDLEKSVATGEQILKTIKEDLQKTTEDRNKFQAQHKVLLDRVTNMKSTLGTKLQADMVHFSFGFGCHFYNAFDEQHSDMSFSFLCCSSVHVGQHQHSQTTDRPVDSTEQRLPAHDQAVGRGAHGIARALRKDFA